MEISGYYDSPNHCILKGNSSNLDSKFYLFMHIIFLLKIWHEDVYILEAYTFLKEWTLSLCHVLVLVFSICEELQKHQMANLKLMVTLLAQLDK